MKAFGCNMAEAEVEQLTKYRNLCELFTRKLKPGVRETSQCYELVSLSPAMRSYTTDMAITCDTETICLL